MSANEHLLKLRTTAWITAGARYNAVRRLQRRSRLSLITISLLSGAGVLAPFLLPQGSPASQFSAFLAMLVLVVGIIETASEFGAKAAMLFANAENLNAFQSRLGTKLPTAPLSSQELEGFDAEYQRIKKEIQYNHEPVDFDRFKLQHGSSPEFVRGNGSPAFDWLESLWVRLAYEMHSVWWLVALWGLALVGFFWALSNG